MAHGPKLALRAITSHLVTDMCMYSHAIVGVSPHDYGSAMVRHICPTHAVSVTHRPGVTVVVGKEAGDAKKRAPATTKDVLKCLV